VKSSTKLEIFKMPIPSNFSRRNMLQRSGCGLGMLGLAGLLRDEGLLESASAEDTLNNRALNPLAPQSSHFDAKAKRVIWIFINGGPSPVDTWNYRPELTKWNGKTIREFDPEFQNTTGFFKNSVGNLMQSPFTFTPRGECGKMVPDIFPHLGEHVDKMAVIQSGYTESNNHSPALFAMNTGFARMGFPCVGSWVTYGLGSESSNLPGFVVMSDPKGRGLPKGSAANWSAGYLPGVYQGTYLKPQGEAIDNLVRPALLTESAQRSDSPRGLKVSNWHIVCRWRPPKLWIWRANRNIFRTCTASAMNNATTSRSSV
jgi:hypothetical protein